MDGDSHFGYRFLLLAAILAVNGFFAGAEVALLSCRKSRLRQLAEAGNVGAQSALSLLENPERLLSVIQIGVTLASLVLGWAGEDTLFQLISKILGPLVTPSSAGLLHGISFGLSFAVMSYAHVVIGEVLPKNLGIEKADPLAILVAPALLLFYRITEPLVFVIERTANILSRLIGLKGETHGGGHSAEELRFIIKTSRHEGHLRAFEEAVLQRVLDMSEYSAREIMVPRNDMIAVPLDATLETVLRTFLEHQYSRLPVYSGSKEHIAGVVHLKDLIKVWEERRLASERKRTVRPFHLNRVMRKPLVMPETKPINQMLDDFRRHHTHIAFVVDEFGTIGGLVTLEDVLEQIVGEIEDEHDELRQRPAIESNVVEVEGTTPIRDLETQYGIQLPAEIGFETLAGYLLLHFGDLPQPGDTLEQPNRRFTILDMERHRIARVRIEKITTPAETGGAEAADREPPPDAPSAFSGSRDAEGPEPDR